MSAQAAPDAQGPIEIRERIIEVATRLFANQGYGSTSVREVVEAVGVTKPTLYYHFGSKEGLFLAAVNHHMQIGQDLFEGALAGEGPVRDRLLAFTRAYLQEVEAHPDTVRFLMTAQHHPEQGQPQVDLMSRHQQNAELLGELMAEGVASGEFRADLDVMEGVMALLGSLHLRCMAYLYDHPLPDAERVLELFFYGVSKR